MRKTISTSIGAALVAALVAACGSSSHTATTRSSSTSTAPGRTIRAALRGTTGKRETLAMLKHAQLPPHRPHAHLIGFPGSLPHKLQAMVDDLQGFWQYVFQASGAQLTPATDELIAGQPGTCGAGQITGGAPPAYCQASATVELPLGYFASKVAPLGDAAVLLLVADTYNFHVEDALQAFSAGLSDAQLKEMSACLSGIYFDQELGTGTPPKNPTQPYLEPQDLAAVNAELAREASPSGTSSGPGSVTAQDLTSAFNHGVSSYVRYRSCLPTSGGGAAGVKGP